jgi:hypothetical protein
MYKAVILPLAKEDILEAAIWYNKQQKGLGKRFTTEVREHVHFIRQKPQSSKYPLQKCTNGRFKHVPVFGTLYN